MSERYVRIHGPEPLLDREPTRREIEAQLGPQLKLLEDLADYGVLQLKRCFVKSEREIEDVVVVLILFRQVLVALDSVSVLLRNGATYAANLPLRSLFEAVWALEWMLHKEPGLAWKRFYVAFLRQNRQWSRRVISGTEENRAMLNAVRVEYPGFGKDKYPIEEDAREAVADIDRVLLTDELADVDEEFTAVAERRGYEPQWYQVRNPGDTKAIGSIRRLARGLGHEVQYDYLYGPMSAAAHGTEFLKHVKLDVSGAVIEPVRSGEGFATTYSLTGTVTLRAFRMLLAKYRPAESRQLDQKYVRDWRDRLMKMPEIVVEAEMGSLDELG